MFLDLTVKGKRRKNTGENGGLGARDEGTHATKTPFFHFCGRQRPPNSDWLILDSKSHGNDEKQQFCQRDTVLEKRDLVIVREDFKTALHRFTREFQGSANIPLLE